ncbi:hypothetical protein [Rhizobium leguminosarum]|uniref:Uncharacterized protein n=1 Tax=Rhizobium leguminosarum TaxID=384 RepID=A0A6P0BB11_RHILE|nr:hypothetical protein [Rhizobium leguminosarum]MBY5440666.1 hypothetical protein [Rhizobium leguminosarum]NEI36336.1 hypothetical protein [Rhizobium leguminosarum]NEI42603.1 hypothetical protein [Rhizobium leguminosarum]
MNIRRGFFRLWLVLSVIWIVAVGLIGWEPIRRDQWWSADPNPFADSPVRCENATGTANVDYTRRNAPEPWNAYRTPGYACWYPEGRFRTLFPSYNAVSHAKLTEMLYQNLGWEQATDSDKFIRTKPVALFAFVPPVASLIIGAAFVWAFSGFSRPKAP